MPTDFQGQRYSLEEAARDLSGRFKAGNRQEAWEEAAKILPPGDPYRRTLQRFQRTLSAYERFLARLKRGVAISPLPSALGHRRMAARGLHGAKTRVPHLIKGSPEARSFMLSLKNRYYARLSWRDIRWQDETEKRRRLEPMWRARRKAKDQRILNAVHPHIRKVLGDREILRRAGR